VQPVLSRAVLSRAVLSRAVLSRAVRRENNVEEYRFVSV